MKKNFLGILGLTLLIKTSAVIPVYLIFFASASSDSALNSS
jgi:hypothetical protein